MRVDKLKKKVFKSLAIMVLFLGILGAGFGYLYYYHETLEGQHKKSKKDLRIAKRNNETNIETMKQLQAAIEYYQQTPEKIKPTLDGYSSTSSRIRAIRGPIEQLKRDYHLASLDVTFSNIESDDEKDNKNSFFSVLSSDVEIKILAASDELIMSFANDLAESVSGYLQLSHVAMGRRVEPTTALLSEAKTLNTLNALVEGKVSFTWKTVQGQPVIFNSEQINTFGELNK